MTGDIEYSRASDDAGKTVSLTLDVYQPPTGGSLERPVIMLIHGGGFESGSKGYTPAQGSFYPHIAEAFAEHGYVVFSVNYRLKMTAYLRAALEDVHHALEWIKSHREAYRIDATKTLIAGDSAGGAIAVNASYQHPELRTFVGCLDMWGGLPPYGDRTNRGPVNVFPITTETPATCVFHGTADKVVNCAVSRNLSDSLARAGVYHEFHTLEGSGHFPKELEDQIIPRLIHFADRIIPPATPSRDDGRGQPR